MLRPRQVAICIACASVFWLMATTLIRLNPASVSAGWYGDLSFLTALPGSWLCIWLVCRLARLDTHQILPGCMIVLGDAMLLDGIALRWFPTLYGASDLVARQERHGCYGGMVRARGSRFLWRATGR